MLSPIILSLIMLFLFMLFLFSDKRPKALDTPYRVSNAGNMADYTLFIGKNQEKTAYEYRSSRDNADTVLG